MYNFGQYTPVIKDKEVIVKNGVGTNCPICGNVMEDGFHRGDICPCCGNESGFNDDITRDDLHEKFDRSVFEKFSEQIESALSKSDILDKEIAWKLLRVVWAKNGCKWKRGSAPIRWDKEKGKQQLHNAGININECEME